MALSGQLHKDVKIFITHIPPTQSPRTIPTISKFLFSMPLNITTHSGYIVTNARHDSGAIDWCA